MILQALKEYYDRKAADPDSGIAPPGWIAQKIDYMVTINEEGALVGAIERLREKRGKKESGWPCLVPDIGKQALKHNNSGTDANLLWDTCGFVLGVGSRGAKKRDAFLEITQEFVRSVPDNGLKAMCRFLENAKSDPSLLSPFLNHPEWGKEIATGSPTVAFHFHKDDPKTAKFIFQRPMVAQAISQLAKGTNDEHGLAQGLCIITGERDQPIPLCHPVIKGIWNAQSSGATIVGINKDKPAFCSFGKEQAANSPIGKTVVDAYTKALRYLLDNPDRHIQVGDASTVFWSEKASSFEDQFSMFFSEPPKDNPDHYTQALKALLNAPRTGAISGKQENEVRFYVLGLAAPAKARISIRFWIVSPLSEMQEHIRQHFRDLEIIHPSFEESIFSLFRLLVCTAPLGRAENIPPHLEGDIMRAILEGLPYPATLLQSVIRRIKAEQSKKNPKTGKPVPHITYIRAALIKACINRNCRFKKKTKQEELAVSLDPNNMNIGYRLGRLFAVLEKIQEEASPGLNATIRDRYYAAASSGPVTVFGRLIALSTYHLAKLRKERPYWDKFFDKLIREIMWGNIERSGPDLGIMHFPPHLNLDDQGRFAVGYYHQKQDFYTKKEKPD